MIGLPDDYGELTREGQRLARVGLVCDQETPTDFVQAWDFFRTYYLGHEKAYFYKGKVPSPPVHAEWAWARATYQRNCIGSFRGSGKSTVCTDEFTLMNLFTRPGSDNVIIQSSMEKVETRFDRFMQQIEWNPRLIEDFGVLKPVKGSGMWNRHIIRLNNRSIVKGFGITSDALRGERPDYAVIDDPEYDPKEGTNLDRLTADMETALFKAILPMLRYTTRSTLFWIGTPILKRMFLWRIIYGEDPRIDSKMWHRKMYPVLLEDGTSQWPEEWPPEAIEMRRKELGEAFFSEMMCDPGSTEEKPLRVDPTLTEYHLVQDNYEMDISRPLESQARITFHDSVPQPSGGFTLKERDVAMGPHYSSLSRAITVDYAPTTKQTSDFSAVHVLGLDRLNQLWSLDLWMGKVRSEELIRIIWSMARRWRVRVVGVESVSVQEEFMLRVRDEGERLTSLGEYVPQVKGIRYPSGVSKEDRIQSLEWRFRRGQIKLPAWKKNREPYRSLYRQIEFFTPDGKSLEHDDAVDSLAMYNQVLGSAPAKAPLVDGPRGPLEMLEAGQLHYDGGIPISTALDPMTLPREVLLAAVDRMREAKQGEPVQGWSSCGL